MVEWIFDNLQLVIAIVVIVAFIARKITSSGSAEPDEGPGADPAGTDHARQIQEEIRRRILERQRGASAPPSPPPIVQREPPEWQEEGPAPRTRPPPVPVPAAPVRTAYDFDQDEAVLERQRRLNEQLASLSMLQKEARASAAAGVAALGGPAITTDGGAQGQVGGRRIRRAIRKELSGGDGLRRAFLLREILGEPIGLRSDVMKLPRR